MSATKIDRRGRVSATMKRDDELIARASLRTGWAAKALAGAAADLDGTHGRDGNALTGVTDLVLDHAARVSRLAEDIETHRAERPLDHSGRLGVEKATTPYTSLVGD